MTTSPLRAIERNLEAGKVIVIDGATGTELERRGATMNGKAWCAMATLTDPALLRQVHEDYIRAGARVITANTFSTNRNMLEPGGLGSRFEELNGRAVELARQARDRTGTVERVAVAGSMSHQVPIVDGADQRAAHSVPPPEVAEANFREMAELLAASGVDLILMEMMSDPELANPAIAAAVATGLPVWVGFSVRAGESGALVAYARPELSAAEMLDAIPLDGIRAAGVMHSKAHTIAPTVELLKARWTGPLMAYPDSGYFKMPHWQFVDIIPEAGWLVLTHGVGPVRRYTIGAILLELENPAEIIGRLREPLLSPDEKEREGYVPNVVYSCGAAVHAGRLILPYAMSDYASTFATVELNDLLAALLASGP